MRPRGRRKESVTKIVVVFVWGGPSGIVTKRLVLRRSESGRTGRVILPQTEYS